MSYSMQELLTSAVEYDNAKEYKHALELYEKVLQINPNLSKIYVKIGNIYLELYLLQNALENYEKAIQLDPNDFIAYSNIGSIFQKNNQLKESLEYYNKALEINPNYIHAHYNRAYVYLMQGDYIKGFDEYRFRYHHEIRGDKLGGVAYPPTLLTPNDDFTNKTLYISHEQGLGDTIQFIRFLPFFIKKAKKVIAYVPPSLVKLFTLNYPEIDFITPNSNISFEYNFPMLESAYLLKMDYQSVPYQNSYLHLDTQDLQHFQEKYNFPKEKIKIGINYKGSQGVDAVKHRSLELEELLLSLSKLDTKYKLYSLQYERTSQEDKLLQENNIENLGKDIEDFYDTALMIQSMDIIITIDTSFLHLAGALGAKTFALLKFDPDWRWGLKENQSHWYKNVTLMRQKSFQDWESILNKLPLQLENNHE